MVTNTPIEPEMDLTPAQQATLVRVMKADALCLVNKLRIEQIVKHGHSDEADAMEPLDYLPRRARELLTDVLDDLRLAPATGVPLAYKHMAKAAAMLLAGMDRIALTGKHVATAQPTFFDDEEDAA